MLKRVMLMVGLAVCGCIKPVMGQVCTNRASQPNITITVTGEARGRPDMLYIELASEATAGNAADACQQCKQKADVAATAIAALKIPSCEIVREMYEFSSPTAENPYGMMQPSAAPAGTKVSQVLKVKIKMDDARNADKLAETVSSVLDAANKAGVGFKQKSRWPSQITGQSTVTPVKYVCEDATALKKKAIADSLAKAMEIKEALIKSGVQTGKLLGVAYYQQPGQAQALAYWPAIAGLEDTLGEKSALAQSPEEVIVQCFLTYTYDVEQSNKK